MKRIDISTILPSSNISVFQMEGHKYVTNGKMLLRSSQIGRFKNYKLETLNAKMQENEINKALNDLNEDINVETDIPEFVILPGFLKYLNVQPHALVSHILSVDGKALRFVKDKTPELCKIAVANSSRALAYVPASLQTEDICMTAVLKDHTAIHLIKRTAMINRDIKGMVPGNSFFGLSKTDKLVPGVVVPGCINRRNFFAKVLEIEPMAIKHMHGADEVLQRIAVNHDVNTLRYINNPAREIYLEAINAAGNHVAHA